MDEQTQKIRPSATPTCFRHPQRETLVSCGRCGRPLCPDCMRHGPVGVRCADCLRTPRAEERLAAPEHVKTALGMAIGLAVVWCALLVWVSLQSVAQRPVLFAAAPNLLLAGIAGGTVGWAIWHMCGRSHNRKTAWLAFAIGVLLPLCAAALALAFHPELLKQVLLSKMLLIVYLLRLLAAVGMSGFFAWLLATQQRWGRKLFDT